MINKYDIIIFPIKRSQIFFICAHGVVVEEKKNEGEKEKAERNESCLHFKVD